MSHKTPHAEAKLDDIDKMRKEALEDLSESEVDLNIGARRTILA